MSKNIELQEEFEALIGELERLKSINEITSSNSESAKNTINEIKSFVQSVQTFKTSIESDYQTKKKDLEGIENSLNGALGTLNSNVDEQTKRYEKLASTYIIKSKKTLESVKRELEVKINEFINEINILKEHLIKTDKSIFENHNEVLKQVKLLNTGIEINKKQVKKLTLLIVFCISLIALCFSILFYKLN